MKTVIFLLIFSLLTMSLFSQDRADKKHRLSFSVNILPIFVNERSVYIGYCYNRRHSVELCVGHIYANSNLYVNYLSNDQSLSPGTVWNGTVLRLGYKFYYSKRRKQYVEAEFIYKTLQYANMKFLNTRDGDKMENTFYRDENANLYGANIMYGTHLISIEKTVDMEIVCGVGYRKRTRNYTTLSSLSYGYNDPQPLGSYTLVQEYPMMFIGLKIGINTFFK